MIEREIASELENLAKEYPVVTVLGPRQSGKTTLVKNLFPNHSYCNLEHPENRNLAITDPKTLFDLYPKPMIIDEVQRVPDLLSWIQVEVDNDRASGQFILTGSHQLSLHASISQSLAGRTVILKLLPLSVAEVFSINNKLEKFDLMYTGFLPRIYNEAQDPSKTYRNYYQTYIERDVRQLSNIKNLALFEKFLKLLAGRIGQPVNLSSLANDVGTSSTTLSEWLSILEASYIIYPLKPYYNNFGKRLIKSPKIYFIETGLAVWLLGIEEKMQIVRDPLLGNIFENMVIIDMLKARLNQGKDPNLYYWRDNNGNEVDLILDSQRKLIPIEIKSAKTWHKDFSKPVLWMQKNIKDSERGFICYDGSFFPKTESYEAIHFTDLPSIVR